jgi:hypothetical protein
LVPVMVKLPLPSKQRRPKQADLNQASFGFHGFRMQGPWLLVDVNLPLQ